MSFPRQLVTTSLRRRRRGHPTWCQPVMTTTTSSFTTTTSVRQVDVTCHVVGLSLQRWRRFLPWAMDGLSYTSFTLVDYNEQPRFNSHHADWLHDSIGQTTKRPSQSWNVGLKEKILSRGLILARLKMVTHWTSSDSGESLPLAFYFTSLHEQDWICDYLNMFQMSFPPSR